MEAEVLSTFNDLFYTPDVAVEILKTDAFVTDFIHFGPNNFSCKYAIIKGVRFLDDVEFEGVFLGAGIRFEKCTFDKRLIFINCQATGYNREFNAGLASVHFNQCSIFILDMPVINNFERGVNIYNKSEIGNLNIEDLRIPKGSLRIDESTIKNRLRLSNVTIDGTGEIALVKTTVTSSIRYENLVAGSIGFLNSTIEGDVYVWSGKTSSFVFNNGKFLEDFVLMGIQSDQTSIIGADFAKLMTVNFDDSSNDVFGFHRKIFLLGNKFGQALEVNGSHENIDELIIACNRSQDGTIQFDTCNINEATIKGNLKNGNIRFDTCEFQNFHISDHTNAATVSLLSCKAKDEVDSLFEIDNSNVGKLELFNCSLSSFTKVRIAGSLVIDIVAMGVDWFEDARLEVAGGNSDHRGRKEIYRQLKQVCEKQGDRIQALEFQALELISFRMGLRIKDKWHNELTVFKNLDRNKRLWYNQNRWILRFSTTNDFSLNWLKPIYWIVGLTVLFFFPMIVACASPELNPWPSWYPNDWALTFKVLWKHIDVLPQLFNPARWTFRLFPDVDQSDLGFGTHFWDGLQRIVLAFFIVQIVSAFRKYVKN